MLWSLGQAGLGRAGLGRKGRLTWALVRGLLSPALALAPTPSLLQPLVPAPALALLLFMGPGWGGGAAAPAPWAQTGREGEKGRGRATAWEGATEPGEEGGLGVAQRQDPHRHSDTYLPLHATPTPTLSITEIHTLWWCVPHTHSHQKMMETRTHDSQAHTYFDTHRRQHINSL